MDQRGFLVATELSLHAPALSNRVATASDIARAQPECDLIYIAFHGVVG